jgi:uncharacterized protein YecT (DUF1311 family)
MKSNGGSMKNQMRFLRFPGIAILPIFAIFFAGAIALGQTLEEQFQAADAELNRVYKELRTELNDKQKEELKKSQLAWIKEKEKAAEKALSESQKLTMLLKITTERVAVLKRFNVSSNISNESNQAKQEKKIHLLKNELQKCNTELNQVYKNLYQILNNSEKASLEASQKKWLGKIDFYKSGLLMQLLEDRVKATKNRTAEYYQQIKKSSLETIKIFGKINDFTRKMNIHTQ